MSINYERVYYGDNIKIFSTKFDGRCRYTNFLDSLSDHERKQLQKKITRNFNLFDKHKGKLFNKEKFRILKGFNCNGCKEFKIGQIRISFVQINNDAFLLDVFKKKKYEWSKSEKQRTEQLCNQFSRKILEGGCNEF